jgi:hypothetical protein
VSTERPGNALPRGHDEEAWSRGPVTDGGPAAVSPVSSENVSNRDSEALDFVRFCYRRRAVAWPELYDEMCAVAARGEYRGMGYEQLERAGIRFALAALPRLAEMVARVMAEERSRPAAVAAA